MVGEMPDAADGVSSRTGNGSSAAFGPGLPAWALIIAMTACAAGCGRPSTNATKAVSAAAAPVAPPVAKAVSSAANSPASVIVPANSAASARRRVA
jgi:hypothetical protein